MRFFSKPSSVLLLLVTGFALSFSHLDTAIAATSPSLGAAAGYTILSSTYTNTTVGTTINGSIGFTTGPAVLPAGVHSSYGSSAPYAIAGIDQGIALSALALQPCTFTFAPGAIDLATDTTHGSIGVFTPGVYCVFGAASIGTAGITLNGNGTYIFRISGALTTVANSSVTLSGTSACDVFWTPGQATTLGANTTFIGTILDDAGITLGIDTTWIGLILAFGGTVTTSMGDTVTAPICSVPPATLHIIKEVAGSGGAIAPVSFFDLHVKLSGVDVIGSPASGSGAPGTSYSLAPGVYSVSEAINISYIQSFSGDCDASGSILLSSSDNKTCTVTNTYVPPPIVVIPPSTPISVGGGGPAATVADICLGGDLSPSLSDGTCEKALALPNGINIPQGVIPIVNTPIRIPTAIIVPITVPVKPIVLVSIPHLPKTGIPPEQEDTPWNIIIFYAIMIYVCTATILFQRRPIL